RIVRSISLRSGRPPQIAEAAAWIRSRAISAPVWLERFRSPTNTVVETTSLRLAEGAAVTPDAASNAAARAVEKVLLSMMVLSGGSHERVIAPGSGKRAFSGARPLGRRPDDLPMMSRGPSGARSLTVSTAFGATR